MAKVWQKTTMVPWICNDTEDNFFAHKGNYRLEVNRVKEGTYEVQVFRCGIPLIKSKDSIISPKHRAIGFAEGVYSAYVAIENTTEVRFFKSSIQ